MYMLPLTYIHMYMLPLTYIHMYMLPLTCAYVHAPTYMYICTSIFACRMVNRETFEDVIFPKWPESDSEVCMYECIFSLYTYSTYSTYVLYPPITFAWCWSLLCTFNMCIPVTFFLFCSRVLAVQFHVVDWSKRNNQ